MTAVLAFLGGPIGRWLVIALIAASVVFAAYQRGSAAGYKEAADEIHTAYRKQEQAWLAAMARKQSALDKLTADFDKRAAELEKELQGKEAERLALLKKLRERIPNVQACVGDRISRSYELFRNDAARWANDGEDPPAAPAGADLAATPSDVSSGELAEADLGQAAAFRACKERDEGWRKYVAEVEAWHVEVNRALGAQP